MGKMFQASTVIKVLLLYWAILYSPCQVHPSGTFFFQVYQMHSGCFRGGLIALELQQREETSSSLFGGIIGCMSSWVLGQLHSIFLLHFVGYP